MWGMTGAAYLRLKEPEYEDGVGTPRKMSRQGSKLPDALAVSSQLMWTHNDPHDFITALAAIWGQFVANDIRYLVLHNAVKSEKRMQKRKIVKSLL